MKQDREELLQKLRNYEKQLKEKRQTDKGSQSKTDRAAYYYGRPDQGTCNVYSRRKAEIIHLYVRPTLYK